MEMVLWPTNDLKKMIHDGSGKAMLTTVEGGTLTVWSKEGKLSLTDEKGGMAATTIPTCIRQTASFR